MFDWNLLVLAVVDEDEIICNLCDEFIERGRGNPEDRSELFGLVVFDMG